MFLPPSKTNVTISHTTISREHVKILAAEFWKMVCVRHECTSKIKPASRRMASLVHRDRTQMSYRQIRYVRRYVTSELDFLPDNVFIAREPNTEDVLDEQLPY